MFRARNKKEKDKTTGNGNGNGNSDANENGHVHGSGNSNCNGHGNGSGHEDDNGYGSRTAKSFEATPNPAIEAGTRFSQLMISEQPGWSSGTSALKPLSENSPATIRSISFTSCPISSLPPSLPQVPSVASPLLPGFEEESKLKYEDRSCSSTGIMSENTAAHQDQLRRAQTAFIKSSHSRFCEDSVDQITLAGYNASSQCLLRPHTSGPSFQSSTQQYVANNDPCHAPVASKTPFAQSVLLAGPSTPTDLSFSLPCPPKHHQPHPPPSDCKLTHSLPSVNISVAARKAIPSVPVVKAKHKLNLFNPLSLLTSRRPPHPLQQLPDPSSSTQRSSNTHSVPVRTHDPSIRGSIVHDFSKPRHTSALSSSDCGDNLSAVETSSEHAEPHPQKPHTPVFKEHFADNERDSGAAIRAEVMINHNFLARNLSSHLSDIHPSSPPFGLPAALRTPVLSLSPPSVSKTPSGKNGLVSLHDDGLAVPIVPAQPLSPVAENPFAQLAPTKPNSSLQGHPAIASARRTNRFSTTSRTTGISRSSISSDVTYSLIGVPAHSLSGASRFSFQLAGNDSMLEEKMLEERHKKKEAARLAVHNQQHYESEAELAAEAEQVDDYDLYDMNDYEEDIPTVGDDWLHSAGGLQDMTLDDSPGNMTSELKIVTASDGGETTPEDNSMNKSSLSIHKSPLTGLGITSVHKHDLPSSHAPNQASAKFNSTGRGMDDDLYFDDGMIDEINFDDSEQFDESILDDPLHLLYERRSKYDKVIQETSEPENVVGAISAGLPLKNSFQGFDDCLHRIRLQHNPKTDPLTLAGYQELLLPATTKATGSSSIVHQDTIYSYSLSDVLTPDSDSQSSPIPDDFQADRIDPISPVTTLPVNLVEGSHEGQDLPRNVMFSSSQIHDEDVVPHASELSDYDSIFDDDPIIAAANADALANDDDGEYGSEFGFYARPRAGTQSDDDSFFSNGGYFGPKEWSDVQRQKSTCAPSLTPITERSEYSTRNSFVSIPCLDKGVMPSPGLAQLALMGPTWENEMTLENLSRLRRHAFGGSHTSLVSLGSPGSTRDTTTSASISSPKMMKQDSRSVSVQSSDGIQGGLVASSLPLLICPDEDEVRLENETGVSSSDCVVLEASNHGTVCPTTVTNASTITTTMFQEMAVSPIHHPFNLSTIVPPSRQQNREQQQQHRQLPIPSLPVFQLPVLPQQASPQFISSISPNSSQKVSSAKGLPFQFPSLPTKRGSDTFSSPTSSIISPVKSSHSRSGSDTVTYIQETDQTNGAVHWILERRRIDEDGLEQIVGRARIEHGNI